MRFWVIASVLGFLPTVVCAQPTWGGASGEHLCAHAKAATARFAAEQTWGPNGPWGADGWSEDTDVLHYHLDIELAPATKWLGGSNTMTVRSEVDNLTLFRFRLHDVLKISDLRVGGVPVNWVQIDTATVEVTLDRPYNKGEVFELLVAYDGNPQSGGNWGSITFRSRSGAPEIFTLSQPWFAYTWWPAKDDLRDKTTADLWFTVPDSMVVASNGLLQGVDPVGIDKLRYRWKTEYQTEDYLYCIGATNYDTFETTWTHPGGDMPLQFYIYPEDNIQSNRDKWLFCVDGLTVFSDLYGLYPFVDEKYGMLQFGWGGGMEHQTMTSMGGFWEYIVVHELAHMWWGDYVTCATWHDIWLNEGFATYSEALFFEHMPGSPGEPFLHEYMKFRRPTSVNGTVYCYNITNQGRIFSSNFTYTKPAWVLHMLRHVVGKEVFFDILAAHRAAFGGGSVTTAEFQALAEAVTGRDLAWFFDTWVYDLGAPAYRYAWRLHELDDTGYVELYVKQVQSSSYPLFPMPIDIVTTDPGGPDTHVVWNDEKEEHLLFAVDDPAVSKLEFDPAPWILRTSLGEVTFLEGPPKIVTISPQPGAAPTSPQVAAVELVFHKDVAVDAGKFTLTGDISGPVSFGFDYNAARHAATLTPAAVLVPDTYTLTADDSIVDVAAGLALDGELEDPENPESLPSGEGLPGGSAEARFVVVPELGDLNCDGLVDFGDVDPFVLALTGQAAYYAVYPNCDWNLADINQDAKVNFDDIDPFVALLGP